MMAQARAWLKEARHVVAFTGAGISAESGVSTFRGAGGLWRQFRVEELATPEAFSRDPKTVWEWYDWRRTEIAQCEPNAAHRALAQLERRDGEFALVTQNVDGLHDRAGSAGVIKLHGDIWELRCTRCKESREDRRAPIGALPPQCQCGGLLRPGVVWFGETLPAEAWNRAAKAAAGADLFLVVGTSAVVYPAAGLIDVALSSGARVIEVNPDETTYSRAATISIRGRAGDVLPRLIE
jgi:NAD-dependent deacetylase